MFERGRQGLLSSKNWTFEAFKLLQQLHVNPTGDFYKPRAEGVQTKAEATFHPTPGAAQPC